MAGGRDEERAVGGVQHHEQGHHRHFRAAAVLSVTPRLIYRVRAKYGFQRRWKGELSKKCIIVIFVIILVLYIFEEKKTFLHLAF